ncbi:glycoside hydrolase family 3 N-terminal domain-containing protein [Halegenticoccus soli]|uniref:glycoside hydrolase family 3 N-terminal domain-containing protein n=1 Tax=Halegenticoccus soli TaxID=1985678 RepID=UPI000C6CF120|nr:glycoside hydrolase family 3 N-terminal domain-containing protein [Halegenticoccus soli]
MADKPLYQDSSVSTDRRVEDLLDRLTLEEKVAQLGSYGPEHLLTDGEVDHERAEELLEHGVGELTRMGGASDLPPEQVAEVTNEIQSMLEHLGPGIPAIPHEECLSGYMGKGGTTYPQAIGLASTWSPELVQEITTEIRAQLQAIGAAHALSPVLDLARDLRWGRVEETFGEDKYLAARMARGFVEGLQGDGPEDGVAATLKHFVGHGAGEGGKNRTSVDLAPRALAEHAFPFEACVETANAEAVMNAYHDIDGVPCTSSEALLTKTLREEWGFDGVVVSDYESVAFLKDEHGVASSYDDAATMALEAGLDVELPASECYPTLVEAVENGDLAEETVDTAVRRVLRTKIRKGLLDDPYVDVDAVEKVVETDEQRVLARRAARESVTLLHDDGVLPLDDAADVAVVGPKADASEGLLGDYAYLAHNLETVEAGIDIVTPLAGIEARTEGEVTHVPGCTVSGPSTDEFEDAVAAVEDADVAVAFIGARSTVEFETAPDETQTAASTSGEGRDVTDLGLPGVQAEFVRAVAEADTPLAVVVVSGKPHSLADVADAVPALAHAWLPGEEGGNGIADVLYGDHNPSGRLPVSLPKNVGQLPVHYSRKPNTMNETHVYTDSDPLYPFGHGESYTTFEYRDLALADDEIGPGDTVEASVTVENVDDVAGHEVVQVYGHDHNPLFVRPVQELVAFERVFLEPGESAAVHVSVGASQLAVRDRDLNLTVHPGTYELRVGRSASDIRASETFDVVGERKRVPRSSRRYFSETRVE